MDRMYQKAFFWIQWYLKLWFWPINHTFKIFPETPLEGPKRNSMPHCALGSKRRGEAELHTLQYQARWNQATYIKTQFSVSSPLQCRSQAVVCVSTPTMYPRSGYFLVTNILSFFVNTNPYLTLIENSKNPLPKPHSYANAVLFVVLGTRNN